MTQLWPSTFSFMTEGISFQINTNIIYVCVQKYTKGVLTSGIVVKFDLYSLDSRFEGFR